MNCCPASIITPAGKVVVDRFTLREIMRQVLPATAATEDVKDSVDNFPQVYEARTTELVLRQEWFEHLPLAIGQVTWV
jgi:hypothetical protein